MNSVNLVGRLTKDPEIRWTNNDMAVATFTLAIDRPPSKNGEKQADFPRITAFGKTAEVIERYVAKGDRLGVTGRIQTGSYEHRDGYTVYTTDVIADRIDLLGNNSNSNGQNSSGEYSYPQGQKNSGETKSELPKGWEEINDADIPF